MHFISKKLWLAVNTAFFIAYNGSEQAPVSAKDLTRLYDLNPRALEPVLQRLVSAELVQSIKGPNGGYYIARPEKVSIKEITLCFMEGFLPEDQRFESLENITGACFEAAYTVFLDKLQDINLEQLCAQAKAEGVPALDKTHWNFVI